MGHQKNLLASRGFRINHVQYNSIFQENPFVSFPMEQNIVKPKTIEPFQ